MEGIPAVRLPGSPLANRYGATDHHGNPYDVKTSPTGDLASMRAALRLGSMSRVVKAAAMAHTPPPSRVDLGALGLAVTRATDPAERAEAANRLAHAVLKGALARGGGHLGQERPSARTQLAGARDEIARATTPQGRENAALTALMKAVTSGPPAMPVADPDFKPNGNVTMGVTDTVADILAGISGDPTEPDDTLTDPLGGIAYADRPTGTPRVDPRKLPSVDGVRARGVQRVNTTSSDERQPIPSALDSRLGGVPAPIAKAARDGRRVEKAQAMSSAAAALATVAKIMGA